LILWRNLRVQIYTIDMDLIWKPNLQSTFFIMKLIKINTKTLRKRLNSGLIWMLTIFDGIHENNLTFLFLFLFHWFLSMFFIISLYSFWISLLLLLLFLKSLHKSRWLIFFLLRLPLTSALVLYFFRIVLISSEYAKSPLL